MFAYVISRMDPTPCKLGKYIILILASDKVKLKRMNIASQRDVCTYKLEEHNICLRIILDKIQIKTSVKTMHSTNVYNIMYEWIVISCEKHIALIIKFLECHFRIQLYCKKKQSNHIKHENFICLIKKLQKYHSRLFISTLGQQQRDGLFGMIQNILMEDKMYVC